MQALYSHSTRPNITVATARGNGIWNLHLQNRLSNAALYVLQALADALRQCQLPLQQQDHRLLRSSAPPFTASAAYHLAMAQHPTGNRQPSPPHLAVLGSTEMKAFPLAHTPSSPPCSSFTSSPPYYLKPNMTLLMPTPGDTGTPLPPLPSSTPSLVKGRC